MAGSTPTLSTYTALSVEFDKALVMDRIVGERFVTHDEIGEGGFGTVRAVHDRWLGTEVALKVCLGGDLKTDILRLRALPAQYFIRPFDYGRTAHGSWYTMELLRPDEGWFSLSNFSEAMASARVGDAEASLFALFIVKELCLGLGELHQNHYHKRSCFHGDIKPDNVFFDVSAIRKWREKAEGPQGPFVKIIDLGTSLEVGNPSLAMTPDYAAPEQENGSDCSIAVDAFAAGQVLFNLLARVETPLSRDEIGRKQKITPSLKHVAAFVREKGTPLVEKATRAHHHERARCAELASELADLFDFWLDPPVWRAIRICEQMAASDSAEDDAIAKPEFLSRIETDLLQSQRRKKTSQNLREDAKRILERTLRDGIFISAGRNLLRIA